MFHGFTGTDTIHTALKTFYRKTLAINVTLFEAPAKHAALITYLTCEHAAVTWSKDVLRYFWCGLNLLHFEHTVYNSHRLKTALFLTGFDYDRVLQRYQRYGEWFCWKLSSLLIQMWWKHSVLFIKPDLNALYRLNVMNSTETLYLVKACRLDFFQPHYENFSSTRLEKRPTSAFQAERKRLSLSTRLFELTDCILALQFWRQTQVCFTLFECEKSLQTQLTFNAHFPDECSNLLSHAVTANLRTIHDSKIRFSSPVLL